MRKLVLFALACSLVAVGVVLGISEPARSSAAASRPFVWVIGHFNQLRPSLNVGNNGACLEELRRSGVQLQLVPDQTEDAACILDHAVRVSGPDAVFKQPFMSTCSLARALRAFEHEELQALAQEFFKQGVASLRHLGTYNCRPVRGHSLWLSEHAYANAIDVASFKLTDGTEIVVERDWKGSGPKSQFLHRVAQSACRHFRRVVTPNADRYHFNHLHFDNGLFPACQI